MMTNRTLRLVEEDMSPSGVSESSFGNAASGFSVGQVFDLPQSGKVEATLMYFEFQSGGKVSRRVWQCGVERLGIRLGLCKDFWGKGEC